MLAPVSTPILLHITSAEQWNVAIADGVLIDPSLEREGFIHCSTPDQVLIPANDRYAGRRDLLLLVVDPSAIDAEVVFEDSYGSGIAFPHVYGPIPTDAVRGVVDFPPGPDGRFRLPPELST